MFGVSFLHPGRSSFHLFVDSAPNGWGWIFWRFPGGGNGVFVLLCGAATNIPKRQYWCPLLFWGYVFGVGVALGSLSASRPSCVHVLLMVGIRHPPLEPPDFWMWHSFCIEIEVLGRACADLWSVWSGVLWWPQIFNSDVPTWTFRPEPLL